MCAQSSKIMLAGGGMGLSNFIDTYSTSFSVGGGGGGGGLGGGRRIM